MVEAFEFSLFDPGNVGAYPGRVEKVRPGDKDVHLLDLRQTDDRKAGIVTVMLSVQHAGTPGVQPLRAPIAHIEWGVSGGRDSVDVDFLHGQAISIPTTYLRITASFPLASEVMFGGEALVPGFGKTIPDDDQQVLLLGASIGSMPHAQAAFGATPRLTTIVRVGEDALTPFVPVPNHAQSVTVLAPPTVAVLNISAFTIDAPSGLLYGKAVSPSADVGALPIARGIEFIQVDATGAGPAASIVTLLWTLGL